MATTLMATHAAIQKTVHSITCGSVVCFISFSWYVNVKIIEAVKLVGKFAVKFGSLKGCFIVAARLRGPDCPPRGYKPVSKRFALATAQAFDCESDRAVSRQGMYSQHRCLQVPGFNNYSFAQHEALGVLICLNLPDDLICSHRFCIPLPFRGDPRRCRMIVFGATIARGAILPHLGHFCLSFISFHMKNRSNVLLHTHWYE